MRVVAALLLVGAMLSLPMAHASPPALSLQSGPSQPGDYTLQVSVSGISLVAPGSAPNQDGQGHLVYLLNDEPCDDETHCDGDYATTLLAFHYHELASGDVPGAELVQNDGTSFQPRIVVTRPVPGTSPSAPSIRLAGAPPVPGDYLMQVAVANFNLVDPADGAPNKIGEGHIQFLVDSQICSPLFDPRCSAHGDTDSTSFSFKGLALNDVVSARLVGNDGVPLSPSRQITLVTYSESVAITSAQPRVGDYRLTAGVAGLTLVAPAPAGQPPKANKIGEGHLVYLLNGAPCISAQRCAAAPETTALSFDFRGLTDQDIVGVRVLENDGTPVDGPGSATTLEDNRIVLPTLTPQIFLRTSNPNPGLAYTMRVQLRDGELVDPGTSTLDVGPQGHFVYMLDLKPCTDTVKCVGGDPETTALNYTFANLVEGDLVGVEFVTNTGQSYAPVLRIVVATAAPRIVLLGEAPRAGDGNVTAAVTGLRLRPLGLPNNSGEGHLHFMLNGVPCDDTDHCDGPYATTDKTYHFHKLKAGDHIQVELVQNDHSSFDPPIMANVTVLPKVPRANPLPGPSPVFAVALVLAAAFVVSRRK